MKTSAKTIKVGAVSPRIRLADVSYNVKECIKEAKRAASLGAKLLVFPELTLTGATCGDLFTHRVLVQRAELGLREFVDATCELDMISLIGLPLELFDLCRNAVAAVYKGEILGIYVKNELSYDEQCYFCPMDFGIKGLNVGGLDTVYLCDNVFVAPFDDDVVISIGPNSECANILACSDATAYTAGDRKVELITARQISGIYGIAYVYANGGIGESTTDGVYAANNIIADRGEILAEALPFAEDNLILADVTVADMSLNPDFECPDSEDDEPMSSNPFLPIGKDEQREVCLEALEIQSQALAARVERSYSKAMVIGVSGGLDSTLALLVCARAADILGMDRKNVIGVTMPCFGTTKRTKSNAEKLSEALGISFRTVDIKASVTQHLADIGHDGVTPDVTFENAQARERTQVLMDIANMTGGLVVGTGDLSELVLGWATYNGDHMSMYAVNASVPKTMVRRIVEVYSEEHRSENSAISDVLDDILATPVSPELLPPKDGEIAQCTEELVGPYELHDFFIYYTLNDGLSPREIYDLAKESFEGVYDNKTILGWLRVFVRRFISQQFKRSCSPDGPKVSCISVSPRGALRMPSDASSAVWLAELDEIERPEK
jgi:NAD+ synthase (glutamine-hydrolysing)